MVIFFMLSAHQCDNLSFALDPTVLYLLMLCDCMSVFINVITNTTNSLCFLQKTPVLKLKKVVLNKKTLLRCLN